MHYFHAFLLAECSAKLSKRSYSAEHRQQLWCLLNIFVSISQPAATNSVGIASVLFLGLLQTQHSRSCPEEQSTTWGLLDFFCFSLHCTWSVAIPIVSCDVLSKVCQKTDLFRQGVLQMNSHFL